MVKRVQAEHEWFLVPYRSLSSGLDRIAAFRSEAEALAFEKRWPLLPTGRHLQQIERRMEDPFTEDELEWLQSQNPGG